MSLSTDALVDGAIARGRATARESGFLGVPRRLLASVDDAASGEGGTHFLRVVEYEFPENPGGGTRLYVEAVETHDGAGAARILPLSSAVHILQNISDDERWRIEGREAGR